MKQIFTPLIFLVGLGFSGCMKSGLVPLKDENSTSISSASVNALSNSNTKIGVLSVGFDVDDKIDIANKLGVSYVRDGIIMTDWNKVDKPYERLNEAGFRVLLNINYDYSHARYPIPFPTELNQYKSKLADILDNLPYAPEVVVIENEEMNKVYHSGPMEDYISLLEAAIDVCHERGLKVANGGLPEQVLCMLVYRDFLQKGMIEEAIDWADLTLDSRQKNQVDNDNNDNVDRADLLLEAYAQLPLDYVNVHIYEPFTDKSDRDVSANGAIATIADYLRNVTGKDVITNETGALNTSPELVTSMLDAFVQAGYPYVIWTNVDGSNGNKALTDKRGNLYDNGIAFKNYMENNF